MTTRGVINLKYFFLSLYQIICLFSEQRSTVYWLFLTFGPSDVFILSSHDHGNLILGTSKCWEINTSGCHYTC